MKFIKHENSMDVCYEIFASDDMDYFCYAWNMGFNSTYQIDNECIKIPMMKIFVDKGWQKCDNYKEVLEYNLPFRGAKWTYLQR